MKIITFEFPRSLAHEFTAWLLANDYGTIGLTYATATLFDPVVTIQVLFNDPEGLKKATATYQKHIIKTENC